MLENFKLTLPKTVSYKQRLLHGKTERLRKSSCPCWGLLNSLPQPPTQSRRDYSGPSAHRGTQGRSRPGYSQQPLPPVPFLPTICTQGSEQSPPQTARSLTPFLFPFLSAP